ncbi:MAG: sulfurtransferase TusA family protein [Nitrospirota bacterium]|jgi:tRNA 2-thiouridine synthesizing protein A
MAVKFEKVSEGSYHLDCLGYVCPHPQIYTKKMLEKLQVGDTLAVLFDNPSSSESISAMVEAQGDEIIEKTMEGGKYVYTIRKS